MPTAAGKAQFDAVSFRKFVRLMDSPVEGERHAALYQALKQCGEHRPPLLFFEAASLALGNNQAESDALREKAARLQVEVDDLTSRLQQREAEAAQLADKFMEAKGVIEQLVAEREKKAGGRGSHDFRALRERLWSMPQVRLVLVTLAMSTGIIINSQDGSHFLLGFTVFIGEIWLFVKWTSLQFRQDGLLQLLIKLVSFVFGLFATACASSMTAFGEILVLIAFSALTASRLAEWLVEDVGRKFWESDRMQMLRGWF